MKNPNNIPLQKGHFYNAKGQFCSPAITEDVIEYIDDYRFKLMGEIFTDIPLTIVSEYKEDW